MTADERKSETPRTDAVDSSISDVYGYPTTPHKMLTHAQQLERELTAANEQIKRVREALEQCKSYISDASPDYRRKYGVMGYVAVVEAIDRALKC